MPKKLKEGFFGILQHPFCRKIQEKIEGGPFGGKTIFEKKSNNDKKTERGTF